jgi:tetratricopeptide (TPR) repeat protein
MHERHALELVEKALANHARSDTARRASGEREAEYWSVKAWALALGGNRSEADEALASAFRLAHRDYVPVLALIHVRAGRVYSLRGDQTRAKENFQKAVELDPEGYAGNSARDALKP